MAINGTAVAITSLGGLLLYSAVKGAGIGDTAHALLAGKAVATAPSAGDGGTAATSGGAALQDLLTAPVSPGSSTPPNTSGSNSYNAITGQWGSSNASPSINTYLKGMNFTRGQRAGIMGNMQVESNFDPGAYNANEGAIGICQWEGGRRTALRKYASARGKQESDLSAQLGYFHLEMNTAFAPVQAMIRATSNPGTVATIFDASYEISAGTSRAARIAAAKSLFASDVTA